MAPQSEAIEIIYRLFIKHSSRTRNITFVVRAFMQIEIKCQYDQLVFQSKTLRQRFANTGQRLLERNAIFIINRVFQAGIVIGHDLLCVGFQQRINLRRG